MGNEIKFKLRKGQQSLINKKYAIDESINRLSYKSYKLAEDFWAGFLKDHPELEQLKEALTYFPKTKTVGFKHKWQEDHYKQAVEKMMEG